MKSEPFGPLDPALYRETVRRALAEDLGWGDVTSEATVLHDQRARGTLAANEECVLAGLDVALEAFRQLEPAVRVITRCQDGERCARGTVIAEIEGRAQPLLTAERVALNFVQRLSGIATLTRRFVDAAGGRIRVFDTRKTTPLLRALEKYAVRAGGGGNHRLALDEGVLIKRNHVRMAGGLTEALRRAHIAQPDLPIEVEVESLADVEEALAAGATRVLVDHLPVAELHELVSRTRGRAQVEVSGSIAVDEMEALAASGADVVSLGALTQAATCIDMSFELHAL